MSKRFLKIGGERAYQPEPGRGQTVEARVTSVYANLAGGRLAQAETAARGALALDPNHVGAHIALARVFCASGRLAEAESLLVEAISSMSSEGDIYAELGAIQLEAGKFEEARTALLRALLSEPEDPWLVQVNLGKACRKLGRREEALRWLRECVYEAPARAIASIELAYTLRSEPEPDVDEALLVIDQALALSPSDAGLLVCRAQLFGIKGEWDQVVANLEQAVAVAPNHPSQRSSSPRCAIHRAASMLEEDYLPGEAIWDGCPDRCNIRNAPKVSPGNADLLGSTIIVAARFLDDLAGARERPISFRFGLREDSPDFIKLDVLGTMIVVGARTEVQPIARVLQAAVRARQMSMMGGDSPILFVPIVVFGESDGHVFYVESPQEPGMISAWFVKAAVEFLAKRLGPACAAAEAIDLQDYLERMEVDGADPLEILRWQPLLRSILDAAPTEVLEETRRQIATELRTRL